jgi:hypothetical protein
MERRKAIIAAATASLTLLAGAAAISLNTAIVGASGDDGVGQVSPVDATTPSTIYLNEPDSRDVTPFADGSTAAGERWSSTGDEDRDDEDHDGEDDDRAHDDDHEGHDGGDEHEYEGADDDD